MPYFSGGPLRETPSTLLLALDAASQGEAYGVTIYEDPTQWRDRVGVFGTETPWETWQEIYCTNIHKAYDFIWDEIQKNKAKVMLAVFGSFFFLTKVRSFLWVRIAVASALRAM